MDAVGKKKGITQILPQSDMENRDGASWTVLWMEHTDYRKGLTERKRNISIYSSTKKVTLRDGEEDEREDTVTGSL